MTGFCSSPPSVMARSRLFRPSMGTDGADGTEWVEDGGGDVWGCAGAPPPRSMSSSAHSHDKRYLASMLRNAVLSWERESEGPLVGAVLAREREEGFGRWMKDGETGRDWDSVGSLYMART